MIWPVSFSVEVFLIAMIWFLWSGRLPSRMLILGFIAAEIILFLGRQTIWVESGGVVTIQSFFYPSPIPQTVPFLFVLFGYVALANVYEIMDRDIFGRKVKERA